MLKDYIKGMSYIIRGTHDFFHDKESWRYAFFPLILLFVVYFFLFWGIIGLSHWFADKISQAMAGLPGWLSWLGNVICGLSYLTGTIAALLILGMTVCTLYEIFGGLFFDSLVEHHESRKYGPRQEKPSWSANLKYCIESILLGIQTAIVFCGLFVISLIFPVFGQIVLVICMGHYLGLSYIFCSANRNGVTVGVLKKIAGKKTFVILGFGITCYLLLMVPFAALIFLPGLVLGGSELFNNELKEYV